MSVTLERRSGWLMPALILVGLAGVCIAGFAYMTAPPAETIPVATPRPEPKIHVPMFVDPAQVRPTPRFRFTFDPPEALAELRREENLDALVEGATDDMQRCVQLMAWTRKQWEPGVPDPYPPLDARIILRDIRRGFTGGFCAQYNYVLAQSLQSLGLPARYVSVRDHEVIEVRLADQGRWVCLDPLYDTYYVDAEGLPLSVYGIHRRVRDGEMVKPSNPALIGDVPAHMRLFRSFAVWLKNDHVSSPLNFTDLERYKVYFADDPDDRSLAPPNALTTSEAIDLYPG